MSAREAAVEVRFATEFDDHGASVIFIETRRFPVPAGVVAAEQGGTAPWAIWLAEPRGRDLTPREARAFADALLAAADFVDSANKQGATS